MRLGRARPACAGRARSVEPIERLAARVQREVHRFPQAVRESDQFKRVYGVESVVWGVYLLARSALRLAALIGGSVGAYLVVAFLTGTPMMLGLIAWSVWYAVRQFSDEDEPDPKCMPAPALGSPRE